MQPESAKLLRDALDAGNLIRSFVSGKTREDFRRSPLLRSGVHWNFAVIGESLSQLQKQDPVTVEHISEWRRIIGFRNQLIHGYGVISDTITWDIVEAKLPILIAELERLLQVQGDPPP